MKKLWNRFKHWLIKKLGGYTEEQTKVVEKIVEKPLDEVRFTYHQAKPVCVSRRITLNRLAIKYFQKQDAVELVKQIKSRAAFLIGEQLVEGGFLYCAICHDLETDNIVIECKTDIVLNTSKENFDLTLTRALSEYMQGGRQ